MLPRLHRNGANSQKPPIDGPKFSRQTQYCHLDLSNNERKYQPSSNTMTYHPLRSSSSSSSSANAISQTKHTHSDFFAWITLTWRRRRRQCDYGSTATGTSSSSPLPCSW
mmetsp:Transcript_27256/g.75192  ORF Transcript_27256/g.75192 Transcript_27256/m.75192 type:complete len:110 (+) Transcript_27256:62-391(+)